MRRSHRRDVPAQPEPPAPEQTEAPKPPSASGVEPIDPPPAQPEQQDPPADPETNGVDETEKPEEEDEQPHPLTDLQAKLRDLLDFDQITEVRLALLSRASELEKHIKKATDLGVFEEDARRRLRCIQGEATRFGLSRIFEREEATYQRDIFFDRDKPNGRPDGHVDDFDVDAEAELLAAETGTATDDGGEGGWPGVEEQQGRAAAEASGISA